MKKVTGVSLMVVRERERESYTLLNKDSYNNIYKKTDNNKTAKSSFLLLSFCV